MARAARDLGALSDQICLEIPSRTTNNEYPVPMDFSDALYVVQALCGAWLLPHTVAKLSHIDKASEFFDKIRFRPARVFVVLTAVMEAIAAASLILDIYPELGALIAATILVVAAWAQAKVNGVSWRWQFKGAVYMLVWAAVTLLVVFL
jgi:putative oxidoreductase